MKDFYTENDVIRCAALDAIPFIAHGFSTRNGGVSTLPHTASMNLGYNRGDPDCVVDQNFNIFAEKLGISGAPVVSAHQAHTKKVVYADGSVTHFDNVDGFYTDKPGVALLVKTADCQPILLCDEKARIIGACHAGWRGTVAGIAAETVAAMTKLGADPVNIKAACGPCISTCCFEVGQDFVDTVAYFCDEFLQFVKKENGKYRADIKAMNRHILMCAGVPEKNVFVSDECTCCRPDKFFSHRYSKGLRGTMGSVIMMKN